jgi:GHKL domain-containing protein
VTTVADVAITPGAYYGAAYWIAALFFIYQSNQKLHGWNRWILHLFFLVLLVVFTHIAKGLPRVYFIPSMIVVIIMMLVLIHASCDCPLATSGYHCARAFLLAEFAASIEWQIYFYAISSAWIAPNFFGNIAFFLAIHAIVFGGAYLIEKRIRKDSEQLPITRRELATAATITTVVYMLSNLSYVFQNTPFSSSESMGIFNTRTLVDFGGVALLAAFNLQLTDHHLKFEMEKLHGLLKLQYQNFKTSEQSIELVNRKYHDLKHQIAILRSGIESHSFVDYLDKLEGEIRIYEAQNKTGNRTLDTMLTGIDVNCKNHGINMTCVVDGQTLDFMDPVDICTLFGNFLDNAVECVSKLEDEEKKLIHISVSRQRGFVLIKAENYYERQVVFKNGLPVTTKPDGRHHGYGLKSVRSIVERYSGSLTINADGNWFEVRILVPLPDAN